ncbi:MAG TPA: hypothetical protein VM791_05490 [Vicinamibacterales bacterium]|nr:hypothetical protein [Vicinamibacterales bacterium]
MIRGIRPALFLAAIALVPSTLRAQEGADKSPQNANDQGSGEQTRSTGLPPRIKWTGNLDAGWGTFGFANSLFINPREPGVEENLSDQWFEGYVKAALSAVYALDSSGALYGKASVVGERTYGSVPAQFGHDVSSFGPEDLYLGWRSGNSLPGLGDNVVDVTIGRSQYQLGHGFLLYDGAAEGGSRGGYWTNARKAFQFAAIGRLRPGAHTMETFYLDKDELEEHDTGTRLWGANYEYRFGSQTTVGATYLRLFADADLNPDRDGLNVFNIRTYTAPLAKTPQLSFEFEYASERNGDALESNAWTLQAAYELTRLTWKPTLTYRYAFFEGDNASTTANENFDPLLPGFSDWGTWWQGEIAGEYFLSNSNLKSHLVRVHVTPLESLSGGLLFFDFLLDDPQAAGPEVTASDVAFEIDAYAEWELNGNFTLSFIGAFADPGKAVQQSSGRTKNFSYGMAYVAYSF